MRFTNSDVGVSPPKFPTSMVTLSFQLSRQGVQHWCDWPDYENIEKRHGESKGKWSLREQRKHVRDSLGFRFQANAYARDRAGTVSSITGILDKLSCFDRCKN